jgi:hypothetical protein
MGLDPVPLHRTSSYLGRRVLSGRKPSIDILIPLLDDEIQALESGVARAIVQLVPGPGIVVDDVQIGVVEHGGLQGLQVARGLRQEREIVALQRDVPLDGVREQHEGHGRDVLPLDRRGRVRQHAEEPLQIRVPHRRARVAHRVPPAPQVVRVYPRFEQEVH